MKSQKRGAPSTKKKIERNNQGGALLFHALHQSSSKYTCGHTDANPSMTKTVSQHDGFGLGSVLNRVTSFSMNANIHHGRSSDGKCQSAKLETAIGYRKSRSTPEHSADRRSLSTIECAKVMHQRCAVVADVRVNF